MVNTIKAFFMPSSGHFLSGLMVCTFLGFCVTGVALGFISSFTSILLPVSFSLKQPIPSKMSLYSVRSFSTLSDLFSVLILRSFGSFGLPCGSIFSIPSSSRTSLQISGGESIFPLITMNLVFTPLVLFIVTENFPLT